MSQDAVRNSGRPKRSDRRRTLVTPEGIALPLVLASRGTRFGALLIDLIIIVIALIIINVVLGYAAEGVQNFAREDGKNIKQSLEQSANFLEILRIVIAFLFQKGYFLYFELGPRGATPGKRATGIRVAARNGGRLSTEMVLARNLLRDVELFVPIFMLFIAFILSIVGVNSRELWMMTAWLMLFALFPFFNRDRLRAGDLIAGTWVVEAPRSKLEAALSTTETAASGTSRATGASYRFGEEELAVYGEYELQTLERVLRENRQEALIAVHEAICRKIGWSPGAGDERAFLEAYYTQLRARLESGMRMGKRKADKHA